MNDISQGPLKAFMEDSNLNLEELQNDGTTKSYNATFATGIPQFMTKIE